MTDLVGLLYHADWTRLSLAAEVSASRDLDLDRTRRGAGTPPGEARLEWEMATYERGVESRRSTLLIQPGRRYREQAVRYVSGCDGNRSWSARRDGDGWKVEADDGPEPPLPPMLRPSWLLTGYTLEAGEPVTAGGREALRVVATPRPFTWSRAPAGARPLDRAEVLVDLGLGILLRHEEILDGRTLSVTELTEVRSDPGPVDDDQFTPPGGWDSGPDPGPRAAPWGPGWEAVKLVAGQTARGLGARAWSSRAGSSRARPFEQATREEPEAEMPPDPEPVPPDAPAVTDQMLHLLHDSRASGFTATLHQWQDFRLMMTRLPDGVRRLGFGAMGSFMDAASEQAPTVHTVSRLSVDGSGRYRLEPARSPDLAEGSSRPSGVTAVGDGRRHWQIFGDEWQASADGRPPDGLARLLGASGLLEHRLYGGAETTVGGRRGYRLRVAPDGPAPPGLIFADDVVADTELGILLRVIWHTGSEVELWYELRDVVAGGDIRIDIPEEARTAYDDLYGPEVSPGRRLASMIAREAARDARSKFRNVFGGR
jgi:hypothetical protein